ncbi:hypothetical protein ACYPKM_03450 [Pseudomonas aeruginosa]
MTTQLSPRNQIELTHANLTNDFMAEADYVYDNIDAEISNNIEPREEIKAMLGKPGAETRIGIYIARRASAFAKANDQMIGSSQVNFQAMGKKLAGEVIKTFEAENAAAPRESRHKRDNSPSI